MDNRTEMGWNLTCSSAMKELIRCFAEASYCLHVMGDIFMRTLICSTIIVCIVGLVPVLPNGTCHGASTTVPASDSILAVGSDTSSNQTEDYDWVGNFGGFVFRSAIKFDLSSLPGTVTRAILQLRVADSYGDPTVQVNGSYDDSWREAALTFPTSLDVPVVTRSIVAPQVDTTEEFDVTAFIKGEERSNGVASLVLTSTTDSALFGFYSNEAPTYFPRLVVTTNVPPVNGVPSAQTISEDTALVLSSAGGNSLSVSDAEGDPLTTTLSIPASKGTLTVTTGGGALIMANGTNSVQISGTAAQLNAALATATYIPPANANGAPYTTLSMVTSDGMNIDTDAVTITVTAVNDKPVITVNNGLVVAKGGSRGLSSADLASTDVDNTAIQLSYRLLSLPSHGELRLSDAVLGVGDSFTQQDINDGKVEYGHAGDTASADSFSFTVADTGGQTTAVGEFHVTVDQPPLLNLSMLANGSATKGQTLNIAGQVADDLGAAEVRINGQPVPVSLDGSFSYALTMAEGANTITVVASDSGGQVTTETRTVTFDATAPPLVITTPADNSATAESLAVISGTTDADAIVEVSVNGGNTQIADRDIAVFNSTVILVEGLNTIDITSTDPLGNSTSVKRTILYDAHAPALAVTSPDNDTTVNTSSLVLEGTVTDALGSVAVTVTMGSQNFTPPVENGIFRQPLTLSAGGTYAITVTAIDAVGHVTTVQRNVIFDPRPLGDVNGDGVVNLADAILVLRTAVGRDTATADRIKYGDVSPFVGGRPVPDGVLSVNDAIVILKKIVGLLSF